MVEWISKRLVGFRRTALLAIVMMIAVSCSVGTASAQMIGIRSNPPYSVIENGARDGIVLKTALAALSKIGIS